LVPGNEERRGDRLHADKTKVKIVANRIRRDWIKATSWLRYS